jgi:hypothetical protein
MVEINCNGTNILKTPADLDLFAKECSSTIIVNTPSVDIQNYTNETLVIPVPFDMNDVPVFSIINSDKLTSMDISTLVEGGNQPRLQNLTAKNLSNLETIQLGQGALSQLRGGETATSVIIDNVILQSLPKLKSIAAGDTAASVFTLDGDFVMGDLGDGLKPLLKSLDLSVFSTNKTNVFLYNTNIPNVTLNLDTQAGNINFSNPSTLPVFNIAIPNLQQAAEVRFANVANLSLPLLQTVSADFGISDSLLTSIEIGSLRSITGNLKFQNLNMREELNLGSLAFIGGSVMINNTNLVGLASSPLATVGGDIYINGDFSSYGILRMFKCKLYANQQAIA